VVDGPCIDTDSCCRIVRKLCCARQYTLNSPFLLQKSSSEASKTVPFLSVNMYSLLDFLGSVLSFFPPYVIMCQPLSKAWPICRNTPLPLSPAGLISNRSASIAGSPRTANFPFAVWFGILKKIFRMCGFLWENVSLLLP